MTQSRQEAQLFAAVGSRVRLKACMRRSHTTFGYGAYGFQTAVERDEASIKVPGGSDGVGANEKSLQPAAYMVGRECFELFIDAGAVVFLCNVMGLFDLVVLA